MTKTKFTNAAITLGLLLLLVLPACAGQFTVSSIDPNTGYNNGTVAIINLAGTNFSVPIMVNLKNESFSRIIPTTGFGFVTPTQIQCIFNLEGQPAGLYNVSVVNGSDTLNNATLPNGFQIVNPPPGLSSINPHTGINNDPALSFVVTGTNLILSGATLNLTCSGTTIKATNLVELIPNTSVSGKFNLVGAQNGTWYVDWKNYDQNISNSLTFTITNPLPTINPTGISPTGTTNDIVNQPVTVTGTGYLSGATVALIQGSKQVPINGPNIFIVTPNVISFFANFTGQPVGPYNVTVINPDNQNVTQYNGIRVFYPASPIVENITPNTGINTSSITNVIIGGSGFQPGAIINLTKSGQPDIYATSVIVNNQSYITCTLPITGATTGAWNVKVTNNDTLPGSKYSGFTITAPLDSITNLHNSTYLQTSIKWVWTDPTSPDFDHVMVYLNGAFKENVAKGVQTYTASSLTPGTSYTIGTNTVGTIGQVNTTWVNLTNWTAPGVPPVVNFTASPTAGFAPLPVTFTDQSITGPFSSWLWTFGIPGPQDTSQNPSFTYSQIGNFTVNLTVTNATGTTTISKPDYIIVTNKPHSDFTMNVTTGIAPLTVAFTNNSQYADGWSWNFGDGSNSTEKNPIHTYTTARSANYSVSLTTSNAGGIGDTVLKTDIKVLFPCPIANFTATPTKGDAPLTVQFTDMSTGTISGRNWDFGDYSAISHELNPVHTYTTVGVHTVQLEVYNPDCNNTTSKLINATQPRPVASFGVNVTNGTIPFDVQFADRSTNNPNNWYWNFGDGQSLTGQKNPVHRFTTQGIHRVTMQSSNAGGMSNETPYIYITAYNPRPIANFTGSPTLGTVPLTVQFSDTSSNNPTNWTWIFGDGQFDLVNRNPVHTYNKAGSYNVTLTVWDKTIPGQPSSSLTRPAYITVTKTPFAEFIASPTSGTTPLVVSFTDQSQGNPFRFYWKFGDGTISSVKNPTHTYQRPGNYTVTETVQNLAGMNTTIKKNLITVSTLPQASFVVNATSGIEPKTIRFTDTSTGVPSPNSWNWDFGDGSEGSVVKNPDHTYSPGVYSVRLVVSNGINSSTVTKPSLITISPLTVAEFTFEPFEGGDVPLMIQFTDNSYGNPTSYAWNFGDGLTTSKEQNPVHTYTKPGDYNVTLTVTNSNRVSSTVVHTVVLTGTPVASFKAYPKEGSSPLTVQFTDTSSNNPTEWVWTFGDGAYGYERNPVHTYNSPGKFTVTLFARNNYGTGETKPYPDLITVSQFP